MSAVLIHSTRRGRAVTTRCSLLTGTLGKGRLGGEVETKGQMGWEYPADQEVMGKTVSGMGNSICRLSQADLLNISQNLSSLSILAATS